MGKETFVLASGSPRRRELLKNAGQAFVVLKTDADETLSKGTSPEDAVKELSLRKARAAFAATGRPSLGADTVVAMDGVIYGKPQSHEEAVSVLKTLRGKTHGVFTGVTLVTEKGEKTVLEKTAVTMAEYSDEFIENYVSSGKAYDKAGGYGVQDGGFAEQITGSLTNVIGLPMEKTEELLKEFSLWQENI